MTVVVITVCYNAKRTIAATLDSIDQQSLLPMKHIIKDAGSSDGTLEIIRARQKPYRHVISNQDQGIYDAMNIALSHVTKPTEYVHFLNADDTYADAQALERMLSHADVHKLSYGNLTLLDSGKTRKHRPSIRKCELLWRCGIPQPVTLYPLSLIKRIGSFNSCYRVASDYDYLLRCLRSADPMHIDTDFVTMRTGGVSHTHKIEGFKEFRDISIAHGCPRAIATAIFMLKNLRARFA